MHIHVLQALNFCDFASICLSLLDCDSGWPSTRLTLPDKEGSSSSLGLGGPNGLLPLAHQNRAVTESFGKSEIPGPKHFCDLSRRLPRHGNSDDLMSFKERVFNFLSL